MQKNPRPSCDLILCYMRPRHVPEERQQLGSEKFSTFNLYLTSTSCQQWFYFISAIPLETCEKAKGKDELCLNKMFHSHGDYCISES